MAEVYEVTIWARGVTQDMEGRHLSLLLANAADKGGKFVQAWDNYADLPDRVGVPLRKYTRISDEEIEMRYVYENHKPNMSIVMDDTIVKGMDILRGMPKGGVLIVNTKRDPDEILKLIPNKDVLSKLVCVDATGIIGGTGMESLDFMGSEGGVEALAVGAGLSAALAGAAAKATDRVTVDNLVKVAANKSAVKEGNKAAVIKSL
ncbi:MAG: 2-oxoacid:acceptor oxidoreductase family protein [Deltaproteobacteria bacterium]|jgi:Pyruvate/2-oxoacid:ferredoxin oxidoreductase gamma subunit|nr:MAG: 2-oxoacid:acceptor oxidoreductase family protein [Deltaproteobacteria bacterium]